MTVQYIVQSVILPKTPEAFPASVATLHKNIDRAKAVGSPIVRALLASDRYRMPAGTIEQHMDTAIRLLREVRQLDHLESSLNYCRKVLDLGVRWRS